MKRLLVCSPRPPTPTPDGIGIILDNVLPRIREEMDVRVLALGDRDEGHHDSAWGAVRTVGGPATPWLDTSGAWLRATFTGRPLRPDTYARRLAGPLAEEVRQKPPDVVLVFSPVLAPVGRLPGIHPAVLSIVDAWHPNAATYADTARGARRLHLRAECARIRRFESAEYRHFEHVIAVTEADRRAVLALDWRLDVTVIGNGVDSSWFTAGGQPRDAQLVVFHGVMDYPPNVVAAQLLARTVLPRVRQALPATRLAIVGRSPSREVRALAHLEHVEVTGTVPDVRPWLHRAAVYVCPVVSGTGVKNKLLEAMASGAAAVATPLGTQGMQVSDGTQLLIRKPDDLATGVIELLGDEARRATLAAAARAYVVTHHDWDAVAARYAQALDKAVGDVKQRLRTRAAP